MDNPAGIDASDGTGSSEKPTAIGIDLGTTYSCVAVFQCGMVEIIQDGLGQRTIPSFVAFDENVRLIGTAAKNQAGLNSLNTVYDVKRLIGRRFDDPAIQEDIRTYPFEVINENGYPKVKVEFMEKTVTYTPEEISAMILGHMKSIAEKYLEYEIKDAVVTVPAYFDNSQREATKNAGKIAGLNVLRIINEPTAAAVAYGLDKKTEGEKNVLIYDLGGGTFDVSIMTFDNGTCEVKATDGNTHLGGEDFDNLMVKHFLDEILKTHKKNLKSDKKAIRRLKTECEKAKHRLSTLTTASVEVERLFDGIDFHSEITRTKFVKMCDDFFQETLDTVEKTLEAAEMEKSEIDEIILVGGSTRIPRIQSLLKDYFNKTDLDIVVNPDEAVAYGAAIQAAILSGVDMEMLQDLLLLDVTPLSLGIQTQGGKMTNLINRNTTIPTREMKYFSTSCDNQTSVMIKVFQGERLLTNDNKMLGRFQLKDIQKAPKKYPKIEVTFDIDTDGILNVSAVDKNTGNQNKITIAKSKEGLSEEEIEKMVQEAKESRAIDEQNLTRINATIDLQNYAKQLISIVKLEKFNLLMSDSDRKKVEEKIEETISSIQNNVNAKISDLESMRQELDAVCTPVMEKYKRASDLHDNVNDEDNSRPGNQFEELN